MMTPTMLAAAQRHRQTQSQPTATSEADTYVVDDEMAAVVRRAQSQTAYA